MTQEVNNKTESKDESKDKGASTAAGEAFLSELHHDQNGVQESQSVNKWESQSASPDRVPSKDDVWRGSEERTRASDISSLTNFRVREGSHDLSTGDPMLSVTAKKF